MKKIIKSILVLIIATLPALAEVEWEIGMGANYGGILGITANYDITDDIELYGGLGVVGGVIGTRYYINDNIRFNANYGMNGIAYTSDDKLYVAAGFNVGADYIWDNGFSLGVVGTLSSKFINSDDAIELDIDKAGDDYTPTVLLSVGYRF